MSIILFDLKNTKPISQLKWIISTSVITWSMITGLSAAPEDLANVPSLDELAGEWQAAASIRSSPALNSPLGATKTHRTPENILGVEFINFPPMVASANTMLLINGKQPALTRTKWFPYQVMREGAVKDVTVSTTVRMHYQQQAILFAVSITNHGTTPLPTEISLRCGAFSSKFETWGWYVPRLKKTPFQPSVAEGMLTCREPEGKLANAVAFAEAPDSLTPDKDSAWAKWHGTLAPGASRDLHFVVVIGKGEDDAAPLAKAYAAGFTTQFDAVKTGWEQTFKAMFTPNNGFFSGNLPTLVTTDPALRRVYYMSAVSLLSVMRTSLPCHPRSYVGNSPEFNALGLYYWDARELGLTFAMLDPVFLKRYVSDCLTLDVHKSNMQEFLTGTAKGGWYSANDMSIFMLINDYLNVTGDRAFLTQNINGKPLIDHLEGLATYYTKLVRPGRTLADYGAAANLLECVPTYIHEVPSLNAANIWMLRRTAALRASLGDAAGAARLQAQAETLVKPVLDLYEPGKGVWNSQHRDGKRVEMRHVLDFTTIGQTIPELLTPAMRSEMTAFVKNELITDHWMRAQSLSDPAAGKSDRPDHGLKGAFSAWPAETARVLCHFGQQDLALDLLHRVATATDEGPFSQSRELMGTTNDAPARIAIRGEQAYNATCGVGFIDAIVEGLFAWHPDFLKPGVDAKTAGRKIANRLINVPNGTKFINLTN